MPTSLWFAVLLTLASGKFATVSSSARCSEVESDGKDNIGTVGAERFEEVFSELVLSGRTSPADTKKGLQVASRRRTRSGFILYVYGVGSKARVQAKMCSNDSVVLQIAEILSSFGITVCVSTFNMIHQFDRTSDPDLVTL